jgi:hypothetical protein
VSVDIGVWVLVKIYYIIIIGLFSVALSYYSSYGWFHNHMVVYAATDKNLIFHPLARNERTKIDEFINLEKTTERPTFTGKPFHLYS